MSVEQLIPMHHPAVFKGGGGGGADNDPARMQPLAAVGSLRPSIMPDDKIEM